MAGIEIGSGGKPYIAIGEWGTKPTLKPKKGKPK